MPRSLIDPETKLTSRQKQLLFAVIKEFCDNNESIGSKDLKEKYGFSFSAATIRNELVKLRDLGYLFQPFTNSGSQPTERAFKLFINQLLMGLQVTNQKQHELRRQLEEMEDRHSKLSKEISRLLSLTGGVGFSVNKDNESVAGIRNLLDYPAEGRVGDILEFLDNLDHYKGFLLEHKEEATESLVVQSQEEINHGDIQTIFSGDNSVLPLGKGYAMVASKVTIDNKETVIGLVTPVHLLAQKKNLELIKGVSNILRDESSNTNKKED